MTAFQSDKNEGFGHPHVLVVTEVTLPDGPLDDGSLEYELQHPPSCKEEGVGEGEHTYTHYVCDVASQEENCGLAFSLRYSGTPITKPGTYRIQGWWNRSPSGPWGPAEYDAGVGVMDEED